MRDRLATIGMVRNVGGCARFRGGWVSILHNVACVDAYLRTNIGIHPTVWPQYTNVTDTQDRKDILLLVTCNGRLEN